MGHAIQLVVVLVMSWRQQRGWWREITIFPWVNTPGKFNSSPLKSYLPNRKRIVFQVFHSWGAMLNFGMVPSNLGGFSSDTLHITRGKYLGVCWCFWTNPSEKYERQDQFSQVKITNHWNHPSLSSLAVATQPWNSWKWRLVQPKNHPVVKSGKSNLNQPPPWPWAVNFSHIFVEAILCSI